MLKTYDLLVLKKEPGGHYTVGLNSKSEIDVNNDKGGLAD